MSWQTEKDRQCDRLTDRQPDKQTNWQTDISVKWIGADSQKRFVGQIKMPRQNQKTFLELAQKYFQIDKRILGVGQELVGGPFDGGGGALNEGGWLIWKEEILVYYSHSIPIEAIIHSKKRVKKFNS